MLPEEKDNTKYIQSQNKKALHWGQPNVRQSAATGTPPMAINQQNSTQTKKPDWAKNPPLTTRGEGGGGGTI